MYFMKFITLFYISSIILFGSTFRLKRDGAPRYISLISCTEKCKPGFKCIFNRCVTNVDCPSPTKYGPGPSADCPRPVDPQNRAASPLEKWFSREIFDDLFPKANLGWGPHECLPYSYESFVIASRYFPDFGAESPANNGFTADENYRRDAAAFFSHAIQETGENDIFLYAKKGEFEADDCFYRGGFYNWFEGGPRSSFLPPDAPGFRPTDGERCSQAGLYCTATTNRNCECSNATNGKYFTGCYFGRGAIQISYNYNYGLFQEWLRTQNITVDLLRSPNLLMTKMDPPLAIMASLWFYMTPQPPKPAMHDIVLGKWKAGLDDRKRGYSGAIFGPTSLVINNECNGEDATCPGGPGENRRIKAFKWFSKYFGFRLEKDDLLSCKNMKNKFDSQQLLVSYAPDWSKAWKKEPCDCVPATYQGPFPYYAAGFFPQRYVQLNEANRLLCIKDIYENPARYNMQKGTSACLTVFPNQTYYATMQQSSEMSTDLFDLQTTAKPASNNDDSFKCVGAGLYADPDSCSSFYQCDSDKRPYRQRCPAGLKFNANAGVCDWPSNVKCAH